MSSRRDHRSDDRHRSSEKRSEKRDRDDDRDRDRDRYDERHERRGHRDRDRDRGSSKTSRKRDREDHNDERRSRSRRDRDRDDHGSEEGSDKKHRKKSRSHRGRNRSRSDKYSDDDSRDSSYDRDDRRKKKKKKSSKSHKEKREKKSSRSAAGSPPKKKPDKSTLCPMGGPVGRVPDSAIDPDKDYFSYHQEFWVYLFREEGTCFNDIDTKEARAAFCRFAKAYNAGHLEEPYYTRNFPAAVIEESKTTKHAWGFKTTHSERKGLNDLQKGVRQQTEYSSNTRKDQNVCQVITGLEAKKSLPVPNRAPPRQGQRPTPGERLAQRRADKRLREEVQVAREELTGGPSSDPRERRLEKKREHSARIHGAHLQNEAAAAGMELSDADLFGGGAAGGRDGDSFAAAVARRKQHRERRDERRAIRIEELRAKEDERQKNMLRMLGLENLQGQAKLKIAPRNDPPE